jgi:hypothetical protein
MAVHPYLPWGIKEKENKKNTQRNSKQTLQFSDEKYPFPIHPTSSIQRRNKSIERIITTQQHLTQD